MQTNAQLSFVVHDWMHLVYMINLCTFIVADKQHTAARLPSQCKKRFVVCTEVLTYKLYMTTTIVFVDMSGQSYANPKG